MVASMRRMFARVRPAQKCVYGSVFCFCVHLLLTCACMHVDMIKDDETQHYSPDDLDGYSPDDVGRNVSRSYMDSKLSRWFHAGRTATCLWGLFRFGP